MKITRITASGVIEDSGEVLPDRESLTPKSTGGVCRKTGAPLCSSSDLCVPCAQALDRILARLGPPQEWTEEEIEALKVRSRKGKKWKNM
jgi:hypothetical protein